MCSHGTVLEGPVGSQAGGWRTLLNVIAISRRRLPLAVIALLLLIAGAAWLVFHSGATPLGLVEALPPGDGPVLYLDFASLRRTGILEQIAGSQAEEADYRSFVEATAFDYRRDLDAVAIAFLQQGNFFVVRGRFSFNRLAKYAQSAGGKCVKDVCSMVGSSRERQISFQMLDPQTLAMGVSASDLFAVTSIRTANRPARAVDGAAWLLVPRSSMRPRTGLPGAVNLNLAALGQATEAVLKLDVTGNGASLALDAECGDASTAASVAAEIKGGQFRVEGSHVRGRWPLPADWLKSLTG